MYGCFACLSVHHSMPGTWEDQKRLVFGLLSSAMCVLEMSPVLWKHSSDLQSHLPNPTSFFFKHKVSPCIPRWLVTLNVDQIGLELTETACLCFPGAKIKGVHCQAQPPCISFSEFLASLAHWYYKQMLHVYILYSQEDNHLQSQFWNILATSRKKKKIKQPNLSYQPTPSILCVPEL